MSKNRCHFCAYFKECRNGDPGCENGEYFYPEDNAKMIEPTDASGNAGRRFPPKSNRKRKVMSIDQFLDNLEAERRFFPLMKKFEFIMDPVLFYLAVFLMVFFGTSSNILYKLAEYSRKNARIFEKQANELLSK